MGKQYSIARKRTKVLATYNQTKQHESVSFFIHEIGTRRAIIMIKRHKLVNVILLKFK